MNRVGYIKKADKIHMGNPIHQKLNKEDVIFRNEKKNDPSGINSIANVKMVPKTRPEYSC